MMDSYKIFREDSMSYVGSVRRVDREETLVEASDLAATGTRVSVWRSPAGRDHHELMVGFRGLTVDLYAGFWRR
jgi:hypothetical protein